MQLAFCLYKYFPYGGLQRDFLNVAQTCANQGHSIRVYTLSWQGEIPANFEVIFVPVRAFSNHARNRKFSIWVEKHLQQHPVDRVIGFNKMPNLDIYYAADTCYAEKVNQDKGWFYKLTPRCRHYMDFERAVFDPKNKTKILVLTARQKAAFTRFYNTPEHRFYILPPGIAASRKYHESALEIREKFRREQHIGQQKVVLLQVGSDFKRKGVDRSIEAIAGLPQELRDNLVYLVVGQDNPDKYYQQAKALNIDSIVHFYAGREDIPDFLFASDLLLHPARMEAAGIVLLEALVSRLPVIVSDVCGYAFHIESAQAGKVLTEPFTSQALIEALTLATSDRNQIKAWSDKARHYADQTDLYSLADKAAEIILGH